MTVELPSEVKHLKAIIDYSAELLDRVTMSDDAPAKGLIEISGRDGKAMTLVHGALVFLQAHMPDIERALERDEDYRNKKKSGGAKR
jgi:hypothetical protein